MGTRNEMSSPIGQPNATPGPFLAKVVGHLDAIYMGGIEVEILRISGSEPVAGQVIPAKYMSPFYGITPKSNNPEEDERQSYGMWMVPPDPGSTVIVFFINGDVKRAYWIGCVQDDHMNFMVPGIAATKFNTADDKSRLPVTEYNKTSKNTGTDSTKFKKPKHPFATVLEQGTEGGGLIKDDIRGITTSSSRRETPSMVFGISTPGPLNKSGKQGTIGKQDHPIKNAYVTRHGGSTFVMDDGDDKYVREKPAKDAAPKYIAIEQGESAKDYSTPHNELIRIRTRTGHQILLHNSEDLIYISHGSGNSWIEMTANGKIDVYAKDSISFHTETDFNFHAGRDINFQADSNINFKALKEMHIETGENFTIKATKDGNITIGGKFDYAITGDFGVKAANTAIDGGQIHLNSGKATSVAAKPLKIHVLPTDVKDKTLNSIMMRVPTHEPYPQHENLDPEKFKSPVTNRDGKGRTEGTNEEMKTPPEAWTKYTIDTDTFEKIKPPEKDQ
jgi:hypothetical protein